MQLAVHSFFVFFFFGPVEHFLGYGQTSNPWIFIVGVFQWHLGYHAEAYTPLRRGFDSHFGYYQGCEDYYDHTYTNFAFGDVSKTMEYSRRLRLIQTFL